MVSVHVNSPDQNPADATFIDAALDDFLAR